MLKPYEKVTVLGAVTDDGDSFYCWTEESLTADHGIQLLEALVAEFGEDLVVFLDRARYFYAKDPMEGCWRQVKDWFNYRLIEDIDALKQSLGEATDEIQEPILWNYY